MTAGSREENTKKHRHTASTSPEQKKRQPERVILGDQQLGDQQLADQH